ncbi:MAG: glycosyltransferase family 39 protein [Elusimicrobia bacterium]|nr:glycosyltransferase family 39 protein [Elusimicrobiota bacterium]
MKHSKTFILGIAVFFLALAFRLALLSKYHQQDIVFGSGMALKHAAVARNLLKYGEFTISKEYLERLNAESRKYEGKPLIIDPESVRDPPSEKPEPYLGRMPGYPILLASTWTIFGKKKFIFAQVLTVLLDSLAAFGLFWIGLKLKGPATGLMAGAFYALWPPTAILSFAPGHDAPSSALNVFALLFALKAIRSNRWRWWIAVGACLGINANFRPDIALLPFFWIVPLCLLIGAGRSIIATFISASVLLATLLPCGMRNYAVFGRFFIMQPAFGSNLLAGIGDFPNPWGIPGTDEGMKAFIHAKGNNYPYLSLEFNSLCMEEAIRIIRENPLWYFKAVAKRAAKSLAPTFLPLYPGPHEHRRDTGGSLGEYVRGHPLAATAHFGLKILALFLWSAALAAFLVCKKERRLFLFIATTTIYYWATHLPLHLEYRYIVPGLWPLFILAAIAIKGLLRN